VTSVLLADDHPLVRQGLRAVLRGADGLSVVGEASDGDEVVRLAAELAPDVVVMDLQMPGLHGIEATRQILAPGPAPPSSC
jgi:DNA-binding NarL/FixJ family response regulator